MSSAPTSKWLRPSAIEGAWRLILALQRSPDSEIADVARLARATYSAAAVDFEVAREILASLPSAPSSRVETFRAVFKQVTVITQPASLRLLLRGRLPFIEALDHDAAECFRRCEAMDEQPSPAAIEWLDELAAFARSWTDLARMESARAAERLSFELELRKLSEFADAPKVEWVSLDDNSAGFDIRSHFLTPTGYRPRLIEVKACSSPRLEFFLSRGEWEAARRSGSAYIFHLWNMVDRSLTEVPGPALLPHVPADTQNARWTEIKVTWQDFS